LAKQLMDVDERCQLLVATPGRLIDLISRRKLFLKNVRFLVLDEADRLLDMGFEPQIRQLVLQEGSVPPPFQPPFFFSFLFFSFLFFSFFLWEVLSFFLFGCFFFPDYIKDMPSSPKRQTLLFSATFPKSVKKLAKVFQKHPVTVSIGKVQSVSENTTQHVRFLLLQLHCSRNA